MALYQVSRDRRNDFTTLSIKVGTQEVELAKLEAKISLFWSVMEKHAATILHHPVTPERDKLIDGYLAGKLTMEELQEFVHELDSIVNDKLLPSGDRLAATFLLLSIHDKHGAVWSQSL